VGVLILAGWMSSATPAHAQMECRTTLGAHMTPIFGTDHLWAIEATLAPGVITDYRIQGGMLLGAVDFSLWDHSNLYLEGGYKNWSKVSLDDPEAGQVAFPEMDSRHLGMRQVFYGFGNEKNVLKVGLHETKLGNYLLVDERVLGVSYDRTLGAFDLSVRTGTVLQNFARMGQFCMNRHLYNVLQSNYTENIGKKPGETNLLGAVLTWTPGRGGTSGGDTSSSDDASEFEEFGSLDEFSDMGDTEGSSVGVGSVGVVLYQEFGTIIDHPKQYGGSIVDFNLPWDILLRTGAVYQSMVDNDALVYIAQAGRTFLWDSGASTQLSAAYIGKLNVDEGAVFQPLFSNLFLGEVMRMDATSFPLWTAEVKHRFKGKLRYEVALKGVGQVEADRTWEVDMEQSIHLVDHIQATLLMGHVESEAFGAAYPNGVNMARLEVRVAM